MQEKISSSKSEVDNLREQADEILNYIPDIEKSDKMKKKFDSICWELDEQLKSSFTIIRNKDEINSNIKTLEKITKKAVEMQWKSEDAVYDLRQHCDKIIKERDNAINEKNEYRKRYERAELENSKLSEKISYFSDLFKLIETLFPNVAAKVREIFQIRKNKEIEQEQQRIADRKKKRFELE